MKNVPDIPGIVWWFFLPSLNISRGCSCFTEDIKIEFNNLNQTASLKLVIWAPRPHPLSLDAGCWKLTPSPCDRWAARDATAALRWCPAPLLPPTCHTWRRTPGSCGDALSTSGKSGDVRRTNSWRWAFGGSRVHGYNAWLACFHLSLLWLFISKYTKIWMSQLSVGQELIRKGIPHHFRAIVWQLLGNATDMPVKNQYSELLKMSSPCEKLIRRDIARTYPEHEFFKGQDSLGQEVLFNVMKARLVYTLPQLLNPQSSLLHLFGVSICLTPVKKAKIW